MVEVWDGVPCARGYTGYDYLNHVVRGLHYHMHLGLFLKQMDDMPKVALSCGFGSHPLEIYIHVHMAKSTLIITQKQAT